MVNPPENKKARVLVVDKESLTRFALVSLIELHPLATVIGEANAAPEARRLCSEIKPDLLVIDIDVARGDGVTLLGELRILHPSLHMIVVSGSEDMQSIQRAFSAGVRAYLSKHDDSPEILSAIESVLRGGRYMGQRITDCVLEEFTSSNQGGFDRMVGKLSNRELCVFRMLGHGKGASAVARELAVSVKTIETHQQRIKDKLNLKTAQDLHQKAESWCARVAAKSK